MNVNSSLAELPANSSIDLTPKRNLPAGKKRLFTAIFGQKKKNRVCPSEPRLDGKRALVTGGAAGVGEFISRGLMARGAEVITMARGASVGTGVITGAKFIQADLEDPDSIVNAVESLVETPIDLLICNAGLISQSSETSQEGIEKTFAINVLGHHILYRLLIERGLLAENAKIIMTSGDIYVSANQCSASLPYDSASASYARSKLGNLWQALELNHRYSNYVAIAIHPGVVASGFIGSKTGILAWLRDKILLAEEAGAQAALIAATQNLPSGSYWHNIFGLIDFPAGDPALNHKASTALWDQLELLAAPYLASEKSNKTITPTRA